MRLRLAGVILCSFLISCVILLPVVPVAFAASISPTQGVVGTEVTVSGLTTGQSYTIKWGGSAIKTGTVPTTGIVTFIVPESSGGAHDVNVESPSGTAYYSTSFAILPSISIDPTSGLVGTTITVNGTGFAAAEGQVKVTLDGTNLKSGITADSNGSWTTTVVLPAASSGNHIVDASGSDTEATAVTDRTFSVYPSITVNPNFGNVGTQVTVSGTGFASSETGISFTYDGSEIRSNMTADTKGSWSSSFAIPQSTKGDHMIDASGSSTGAGAVDDVAFSVSTGIAVQPSTGTVGDDVSIIGSGFAKYEDDIEIFYDGIKIWTDIVADSNGHWSVSFSIPPSANGTHDLDASGSATPAADVKNATLTVEAQMILNPAGGNIGESVSISGTGFSRNKAVDINYGGQQLPVSPITDINGSYATSFLPLEGMSGQIRVEARDAAGVTASAIFIMETTPPEAPRIASPKDGARVGYIGDVKVTFDWTDVPDPSGVFYTLQISDTLDFSTILLEVPKLPQSEYRLTAAESLAPGEYFWRVKATDRAGNSSEWVRPFIVKTAFVDVKTFAYIVLGVIAFVIVISIVPRAISRAVRKKDKWDKDES